MSDGVDWHWLWNHTNHDLDLLAKAVAQGHALEEAINFARYLRNSGLVKMLKQNSTAGPLPVDGSLIEFKANELERSVQACWKKGASGVKVAELEAINRKLDLIAGHVSKLGTQL